MLMVFVIFRIVVRNLCPEFLMITSDQKGTVKLFNYGLYHMTNCGKYVAFPIGHPKYMAPEVLASKTDKPFIPHSSDVWSLGVILIEAFFKRELWKDLKLYGVIQRVLEFRENGGRGGKAVLLNILAEHGLQDAYQEISYPVRKLMEKCLEVDPVKRECPAALLADIEIFGAMETKQEENPALNWFGEASSSDCLEVSGLYGNKFFKSRLLELPVRLNGNDEDCTAGEGSHDVTELLSERSLHEIYYLWQRAGGDVVAELKRQGLPRRKPAVLSLPQ